MPESVSTHSRLKAAGRPPPPFEMADRRFNTQPPEGGWIRGYTLKAGREGFNTQPPEGGWLHQLHRRHFVALVSTHSRLKAAGLNLIEQIPTSLSFNTQPPEGGWFLLGLDDDGGGVSTHSRLKAAGLGAGQGQTILCRFNTQPPEGGWFCFGQGEQ